MLNLETKLTIDADYISDPNLAEKFSESDLSQIADVVYAGYKADKESRYEWEVRNEKSMDLAMQVSKQKNFPWVNCANIDFPLVTIAALQFHSRSYPAMISGKDIVKCKVIGDSQDGKEQARADRISSHMSFQVLEEDTDWEAQHDLLFLNTAIVGTGFIKTYYSSEKGCNISEFVPAKNLVVNYWAKSIESCNRKTHIMMRSRNEIYTRCMAGVFLDVTDDEWFRNDPVMATAEHTTDRDHRAGMSEPSPDMASDFVTLEQHVSIDLDDDGYAEPYIITLEESSKQILRIVSAINRIEDVSLVPSGKHKGKVMSVRKLESFVMYGFIPSPDGGVYHMGLGSLLGPLNASVNSITNLLIDAGTLANTGGGFLGRGAKFRGGDYQFAPGVWKRVDSTGEDLSKSIVPLPVREPSGVLMNLLMFLVDYTGRIGGATDMMQGQNPGQNTPAQTAQTMVQEGSKIYSAIFKRFWRSMKQEFTQLYILNAQFLPEKYIYGDQGTTAIIMREDYQGSPSSVIPVADPNLVSMQELLSKLQFLKASAMSTPGYDLGEIERMILKALQVDGMMRIYPGPEKTGPLPNPNQDAERMKMEIASMKTQMEMQMFLKKMEEEHRINTAKMMELEAKATLHIEAAGGIKTGHDIAMLQLQIAEQDRAHKALEKQVELTMKDKHNERDNETRLRGMEAKLGNKTPDEVPQETSNASDPGTDGGLGQPTE